MATTAEKTPPKLLLAARAPALAGVEDVAGGDPVLEPVLIGVVIFAGAVPMILHGQTAAQGTEKGTWTQKPPMITPRGELSLAEVAGKVYALGGNINGTAVPHGRLRALGRLAWEPARRLWPARQPQKPVECRVRVFNASPKPPPPTRAPNSKPVIKPRSIISGPALVAVPAASVAAQVGLLRCASEPT